MKVISAALIEELVARAGTQTRRRTNHNVHETPADPIQRMFVAAKRDSYFRPHRHPTKWEFAIVICGRFDVLTFADDGRVTERLALGIGAPAVAFEMPANTWHSWLPLTDDAVFLEVKAGPYDPATAAEFAPWSPAEGGPAATAFAERLRRAQVSDDLTR